MPGPIAVVGGTGDEGSGLAQRWARAGLEVIVGSRDRVRAETAAAELSDRCGAEMRGMDNAAAVAAADVVVVTVPYSGQAAIYKSIADHLPQDALVVDATVPVAANVGGKVTRTLGVWEGSAAQQAQGLLPKGTKVCAAFHSLAAAALNELDHEMEGDVLVCGSKSGKQVVSELIAAIPRLGYVDAGPLENARIVEPITALLIGINHRYETDRSGIRITGLPRAPE